MSPRYRRPRALPPVCRECGEPGGTGRTGLCTACSNRRNAAIKTREKRKTRLAAEIERLLAEMRALDELT